MCAILSVFALVQAACCLAAGHTDSRPGAGAPVSASASRPATSMPASRSVGWGWDKTPFICGNLWFPPLNRYHQNLAVIRNEIRPGVTHLEGYYCWRYLEPQKDRWDFVSSDEAYRAMRDKGLRLLVFPWIQYAPKWFVESPDYVPLREVGTGLTIDLLSPWAPGTLKAVDHFYDGLRRHMGDKIDIILIGVPSSDFGEVGLVIGAPAFLPNGEGDIYRFFPQKPEAWHQGLWCGDRFAREDFRKWALKRYGSLREVNMAWATAFASENAMDYPDPATRRDHRRWWIDFMLWYEHSQVDFAEKVVTVIRKHFPGILLEAALGFGDDNPRPALDRTAVCKALAKFKPFGIRSTHAGVNRGPFNQAYWFYKRMAPVCRRFGAIFGTEPPGGDLTADELKQQMFEDASAGVDYVYSYFQNYKLFPDTVAQFKRLLAPGQGPLVDIGVLYPTSDLLLNMDPFPPDQIAFCSKGREFFDYDVVDENMIAWGMLADYRVLIHTGGRVVESGTLASLDMWVRAGGLMIVRGDSPLESVESDRKVWTSWQEGKPQTAEAAMFRVFRVGDGAVAVAPPMAAMDYLDGAVAVLRAAKAVLPHLAHINGFDGIDDRTWTTDFPSRQLKYHSRTRMTAVVRDEPASPKKTPSSGKAH